MSEVIELNEMNFDEVVIKSQKPVLVDFWATWCGPCQMQGPVFEAVAKENDGSVCFAKANVEELNDIAREYAVRSIPTIILFKNGEVANRAVGLHQKNELLEMIR